MSFFGKKSDDEDGHQLSLVKNEAGNSAGYSSIAQEEEHESGDVPGANYQAKLDSNIAELEQEEPITPLTISVMLFLTLAFIGQGMCLTSLGPTLLDLRQIAFIPLQDTAWLFISQSIGFCIGGLVAKPILTRFDNELSLGLCLLNQSLCSAFVAAFTNIVPMCILLGAQGLGIGFVSFAGWIICARIGGRLRVGMFLQAVYFGEALGNLACPIIAHPFLSQPAQNRSTVSHGRVHESLNHLVKPHRPINSSYLTSVMVITQNNETEFVVDGEEYLASKIHYYYVIQAFMILIPAIAFMLLYCARDRTSTQERKIDASSEEPCSCSVPVFLLASTLLVSGLFFFGVQDMYSDLVSTFAEISPLRDMKFLATYLPSSFWIAVAAGRLIGIFVAKNSNAILMLLVDAVLSTVVFILLSVMGALSEQVLWTGTVLLGLSMARMSGSSVAAIMDHLPANSLYLTMVTTARCLGVMIIPSTAVSAMTYIGYMSLMYSCLVCIVITTISLVVAHLTVKKCADSDGRIHSKF